MIPTYLEYEITAAGLTQALTLADSVDEYRLYTSAPVTLAGDVTITPTGTPLTGEVVRIYYDCNIDLNGHTISIFGHELSQQEANSKLFIENRYANAAWGIVVNKDSYIRGNSDVKYTALTNAGGTINLTPGISEKNQVFDTTGVVTLLGSYVIQVDPGATPQEGDSFTVQYKCNFTLSGNTVTIFGINIPSVPAYAGNLEIKTIYDSTTAAWYSSCHLLDNYLYMVMGDQTDTTPAYLTGKVENSIVYDGTNYKIQLDGDVAAPGSGFYYGTDSTGTKGYFPIASNTLLSNEVQINNNEIKKLNNQPVELVANPGAGYAVEVIDACASITGTAGIVTPYATYTKLQIFSDTAVQPQVIDYALLISTVDRCGTFVKTTLSSTPTDTQIVANKGLFLNVGGGDPTAGAVGNYITVKVLYRIISIP